MDEKRFQIHKNGLGKYRIWDELKKEWYKVANLYGLRVPYEVDLYEEARIKAEFLFKETNWERVD